MLFLTTFFPILTTHKSKQVDNYSYRMMVLFGTRSYPIRQNVDIYSFWLMD